ncbi:hypothetical protein GC175_01630 [bacterium]|jgi:hypothetical protein|nr:hypothetical protein [bacterium]
MYPESEILFPYRAISPLRKERGAEWQELVDQVSNQRDGNEDTLAFSLMMIRLCDCLNCDQSSYKASLGCIACARRTVAAEKTSDLMLRQSFEQTRQEIRQHLSLR